MLIRGGTVWAEGGPLTADVVIRDGRIAAVGEGAAVGDGAAVGEGAAATEPRALDARGLDVLPGCIDVHVHLADEVGGVPIADDFRSGSAAAVLGGVTTLASFVTQRPDETLSAAVARMAGAVTAGTFTDVALHLTPTGGRWNWDEIALLVARGFRTFKLYTTYRDAGLASDHGELAVVMPRLADLGARLLVHCEDEDELAAAATSEVDWTNPATHARLRPEAVETTAIGRVLELAAATGCPTHVVHTSTAAGAAQVAAARRTAPVTCETAPQYLLLDEDALTSRDGHRLLCTPPLRPKATRDAMETAAVAGAFDLYATDHCPFSRAAKDAGRGDLRRVPMGLAGVGSLLPLLFELLVVRHGLPLGELAQRLAANPARLLGLQRRKGAIRVGADADLVLVDRHGPRRPVRSSLADTWDPWADRETTLAVRHVLLGGEPVVRDGELVVPDSPPGRLLPRA